MEQRTVRSGSPFEVLALAEHTLGYRPRESLVVVSLRPPRWRTGLVARADLTDVRAGDALGRLAAHLRSDGAGRAFVAVVTDTGRLGRRRRRPELPRPRGGERDVQDCSPVPPLHPLPGSRLARRAAAALLAEGVRPELWLVHRGRLFSYDCSCERCPPDGLPLSAVESTETAFLRVLGGRGVAADRDELVGRHLAALAPEEPGAVAAVAALVAQVAAEWADPAPGPVEASPPVLALALWRTLVSPPPARGAFGQPLSGGGPVADDGWVADPTPEEAARLLDALGRLPLRDVLLGLLVPDAVGPCPWGCDDGALPAGEPCALCWWSGRGGAGPDLGAADPRRALAVLVRLARLAPPGRRAPALGCSAYLLWATGDSLAAGVHAEQALLDDPDHSLSRLVLHGARIGLRPPAAAGRPRTG